ncbi:MAG: hypothetical protein DRI90_17910, partial [Deltaproteobacteria bacterium]
MSGVARRLFWITCVAVALTATARDGHAQEPGAPAGEEQGKWAPEAKTLEIMATPLFGEPSIPQGGWAEALVRITNRGKAPVAGTVFISSTMTPMSGSASRSRAPFSVGVSATVSLQLPLRVGEYNEPLVRVLNAAGKVILEQALTRSSVNNTVLVDVAKASALGSALDGVTVGSRNDPWAVEFRGWPTGASPTT